jgi:uncharacterized protein YggU (UPF0235/DUF167 family)
LVRRKAADAFEVHVREPAKNNRANVAVLQLLSKELNVPASKLWIIKGAHSPAKIIKVSV